MEFLKYLKSPFKYSKDIEKVNIIDSLIMLAINIGIIAVTSLILFSVGLQKIFSVNLFGYSFNVPFKYSFISMGIVVISTVISIAALSAILFLIKILKNKEGKFEEGVAISAVSLLWPTIIIPVSILALAFGGYAVFVIGVVLALSATMLVVNIYEALKLIGLGSGKSAYISSGLVVLFYGIIYLIIYFAVKLIISQITNNMFYW